jgi:hypothetical protein
MSLKRDVIIIGLEPNNILMKQNIMASRTTPTFIY